MFFESSEWLRRGGALAAHKSFAARFRHNQFNQMQDHVGFGFFHCEFTVQENGDCLQTEHSCRYCGPSP